MARKSFSFLLPLTVSFCVSLTVGLSILYFGFYRSQFNQCKTILAQVQATKPAEPAIDGKSGQAGDTAKSGDLKIQQKAPISQAGNEQLASGNKNEDSGKPKNDPKRHNPSGVSNGSAKKPGDPKFKPGAGSTRPRNNTRIPALNSKTTNKPPGSQSESSSKTEIREPAFPRTETSTSENTSSKKQSDAPSMDDPESQDNPLLRALKMARERQSDAGEETSQEKEPSKNPFESLFNSDKKTAE
jgi:hypothetical protein